MNSTTCKALRCEYNIKGSCGLNVKGRYDVVEKQCIPTDNWYILGSFVLDRIFSKNTARDVDLVSPEGEMPAQLPDEVIESGLPIEMIWRPPGDPWGFDFHNISLPRIGSQGLLNCEAAKDLRINKTISALPMRRKVFAPTIFNAIKSMVKYGLQLDDKTLKIWTRSILAPLYWKRDFRWLTWQPWIKWLDWDYLRAEYLISCFERVYEKSADGEQARYLRQLRRVLEKMGLNGDIAYQFLLKYVNASIKSNAKEKERLKQKIRSLAIGVA